jgi:2-dehydropantoate 2-reductase
MTRILCIGLGGLGVIASYSLLRNDDVDITAIVRSDYDIVTSRGYIIDSIDYKKDLGSITYQPNKVVKTLDELPDEPFDYVIVSTKVIPGSSGNIWNTVEKFATKLFHDGSALVLIQNGIGIEKYWKGISGIKIISGVSYISSTNDKGHVTQYGTDKVQFGYFDETIPVDDTLTKFVELYSNEYNSATIDTNVRLSRWRKLLYNASYNTVCCLTDLDIGKLYQLDESKHSIANVILPLMNEIKYAANLDLKHHNSPDLITDEHVTWMEDMTKQYDAPTNYQPSMLVDSRNGRPIELEIILGNVLAIHKDLNGDVTKVEKLTFLYHLLELVQYRLSLK